MPDNNPHDVVRRARDTLALYFLRGSAPAPGAVAFDLVALDTGGSASGAGATVCTDCVSRVAAEAFACTYGMSPPADHEAGTWNALIEVGGAAAYDLAPQSELLYDAFCAECLRPIAGNHIHTCNGRWYIAGPREGRACFCRDIQRLYPQRNAGPGALKDGDGNPYREELARIGLSCDACQGSIRLGETCYARLDNSRYLCCRCTIVL